ncbi:MAG: SWIM zinc finger family protein [Prosthecobacter sp.]|nr:SWIM zinc finger family protein [Prosthecobacter sp.]
MSRETTIRQTHAAITLEALEALANKGLLRRAQKDLERGEVAGFEIVEQGLVVTVSGHRVTLIEAGPAKAACTCPAPGICQHIIAACLKLMQEPSVEPAGDAHAEWLALSDEQIIAAYGFAVLRAAHELTLANAAQIERSTVLTVRFPSLNAEVMALPGAGLAGIIVRGLNEKKHTQLAAAAVLVVRRESGIDWQPPMTEVNRETPVHRDEVLKAVIALLEEAIATGLARLSSGLVERIDSLSISAQTAELHRLGLVLQRIATQATDWLQRRPHADLGLIFAEMATAYALAHAKPQLAAGVARESYIEVGGLDLIGVAAWPWRTPSGYEGLTLLFWDPANATWSTWSDARPRAFAGGFSAVARYTQPGPWEGAESPAQVARSRFRLMQAKRNRWGRLSSSAQSKVLVTGATDLSTLPACDDWSKIDLKPSLGLKERDPRSAYQLLQPASWERQAFDPIEQCLVWLLHDPHGHTLEMRLDFDGLSQPAIERLEAMTDADLKQARLLGRCLQISGRLQVQPLALLCDGKTTSLHFAEAKVATASPGIAASIAEDEELEDITPEDSNATQNPVSQFVLATISALEWLAESGLRARNTEVRSRLEDLSKQARGLGLTNLSPLLLQSYEASSWLRLRWLFATMQRAADMA